MKQFAIIGIGRFGKSIVERLMTKPSVEVFAIDKDMSNVDNIKNIATDAMRLDSTDKRALEAIEIEKFDAVVIAIGEDMLTSVMTALVLKELNVKNIVARYTNERHKAILEMIGVHRVVSPEDAMGIHMAEQLEFLHSNVLYDLAENYSIIEIPVTENLAGKKLIDLDLRNKFKVNIVAIKKEITNILGDKKIALDCAPNPTEPFNEDEILLIVGHDKDIEKFRRGL